MSEQSYSWKELGKKVRNLNYFSYLYISMGIVFLLIGNYENLYPPTPLLYGLSSILFGGILGFLLHQYEYTMCGQEIAAWQSLASDDSIGYMLGRKWYSWLFYLFVVLLLLAGFLIQMHLFSALLRQKFGLNLLANFLIILGSLSFVWLWNFPRISSKLNSTDNKTDVLQE